MFADRVQLDGTLESRISLGSSSEEFLEGNFLGSEFHDIVYVNANPYVPHLGLDEGTFHAVIDLLEEWDSDLQTVHPQTVVDASIDAHARFPNKKLIIHFMQPHAPFIGDVGLDLVGEGWTMGTTDEETAGVWEHLRNGSEELDMETFWEAYNENLDLALAHVETLLDSVSGKTVLTADHGNLVGERLSPIPTRRKYGHPYGVHTEALVKVPWFVIESDDRREVSSDPPVQTENVSDTAVDDRLRALGYR
jgi:hypothetical protein